MSTSLIVLWFALIGGAGMFFAYGLGRRHGREAQRALDRLQRGEATEVYFGEDAGWARDESDHPGDIERQRAVNVPRDFEHRFDGMRDLRTPYRPS